ncbi:WD40-repeat-containing domain protein [Zychaea mexicana]|uniref:WD40-repeat-containing domain protein n=1 Tax=Zychaea mexicana TaxID=64656 RepID=UPI0022FE4002|nr:WD40-repeat-containing domain protein [Zychaea mexicana]KAI9499022.1 WD40-repeat-containing domain protein [Zychaea mexicana]
MAADVMSYRDLIVERLIARNEKEHALHDTIFANQKLVQKVITLQNKEKQLEVAVKTAQLQNETLSQAAEYAKAQGSPEHQQRVAELDRRIHDLNEERAEMYKTQSENAQRLVHMNEQLRKVTETEKRDSAEINKLTASVKQLGTKCDLQVEQLREKDAAIQILQDELAAIQLEITTIEERNKKLEKENAQLLQRWLDKMNQEAEKMNEATEFYESFLEQARNVGQTIRKTSTGKWVMRPSSSTERSKSDRRARAATVVLPTAPIKKMTVHDGEIFCIKASSAGNMFATGGSDKKLKVYDAKSGNVTMTLGGSLQSITSVCFNPTDELVLGSSTDNSTRIWQLSTQRIRHTLTGHIGKVFAAQFTADSKRVVSGSHDRTLKVWDLQRGYCIRTIFTFSSCNDLTLADVEGQTLVSGHLDNNIRLWDTRTGNGIKELTGVHSGQVTSVSVSPGGDTLLTNSRDNTLKLIDLRMYDIVATFQAPTYRNGANWSRSCFSPDGSYIAAGSSDGTLHIWNQLTRNLEKTIKEHRGVMCGVSWSPMGDYLYTAETNKNVCIYNTAFTV